MTTAGPVSFTDVALDVALAVGLVVLAMVVSWRRKVGGAAFAALVAGELTVRRLFTPAHQLIRSLRRRPV